MPTLIASYQVDSGAPNTANLVSPSFTPANGEVIVVKMCTWDTASPMGAVSGGGQTWTNRKTSAPGSFNGWTAITTAVISGSPGSMTVTAGGTAGNTRHSMVVERWGSATLAATPAVNTTITGSGAPSFGITTTAANSAITWCLVDENSRDPATRTYRLSATEDGMYDGHVGANAVFYFAYSVGAAVTSAGTYTNGLTVPNNLQWCAAGIEVLDAGGDAESVTATDSAGLTDTLVKARTHPVTDSAGLTDTVAKARSRPVNDGTGLTDTVQMAQGQAATDSVGLTDAATFARTRGVTDTTGLIDTIRLVDTEGITDSAGLTDSASWGRVHTVTDSVGLTDGIAGSGALGITDSVGLRDTAQVSHIPPATDAPEWTVTPPHTAWRGGHPTPKWTTTRTHTAWRAGNARGRP